MPRLVPNSVSEPIPKHTLTLLPLQVSDAAFLLELTNSEEYRSFIGDRGLRTPEQAQRYIEEYFLAPAQESGLNYYVIAAQAEAQPTALGMVGFKQRDYLDVPDIGFALLPEFFRQGITRWACEQALADLAQQGRYSSVCGFTNADNHASQQLLLKLGFVHSGRFTIPDTDQEVERFDRALV